MKEILAERTDVVGEADTGSRTKQDGKLSRNSDAEILEDQSPQQPKRVVSYAYIAEVFDKLEAQAAQGSMDEVSFLIQKAKMDGSRLTRADKQPQSDIRVFVLYA